jgi:integrase
LIPCKLTSYSRYTINYTRKSLKLLDKHCNLNNPESVKEFIAKYNTTESYKRNLCYAYERYLKYYGINWIRPKYKASHKLPKIPLETKIDMIISAFNKKLALQLSISKETGLRPVEVTNLIVKDIDFNNNTIHTTSAKHGSPRILTIKPRTSNLLKQYIQKKES